MRIVLVAACGVAAFGAAGGGRASAQVVTYRPQLDPDRFVLTSDPQSVGLSDGARPLKFGEFALGMALRVGAPPLQVCVQDGTGSCTSNGDIVSSRFGTDLVGAVGFGRIGAYAQLPIVLYQGSDFDVSGSQLAVSSVGDLRLGGKVLIASNAEHGLAFDLRGVVPTGRGDDFTGDGGATIESRLIYEYRRDRLGIATQLGYAWRQKASKIANLYVDDEVVWSAAADYKLTSKVTAGLAVFGRIGVISDPDGMPGMTSPSHEERPAETMASGRFWVMPNVAIEAGAGTAILDGYGALAFRALLGVRWLHERPAQPADNDWDRDRILNEVDKCPRDPEDYDGFEDVDGCPDLDNDKDTIVDKDDHCPNDPEDLDKFEDADGCPDSDNDKDGIADATDQCPNDPEDKDGFQDDDGCPDSDNDQDGILDVTDKCPMDPEDKDGFEDEDGCPDTDNDKDGLLDAVDKCPNEAETYNGIEDSDGCPDSKPTVVVTSTKVEIKETIYFDLDKATIKPISFKLLNGVASALKAYSTLEISVEGHTDDRADDRYNLKLSQRRADAVRVYLISQGVAAKRLTSIGYGESRPAVPGITTAARDQNRRVEFVIVNQGAPTSSIPAPAPPPTTTTIPAPAKP